MKKTPSFEVTLTLANGEVATIKLPANYARIFDLIFKNRAGFATQKLFEIFIEEYSRLDAEQRKAYQTIANSPDVRTDDMCDIVEIFNKIETRVPPRE